MEMKYTENGDIGALLSLCYRIADWVDDECEQGNNITMDTLGAGGRVVSARLRAGAVSVIKLNADLHRARERERFQKIDANSCREMIIDIFGDETAVDLTDEMKSKIRKYVSDLMKDDEEDGHE